MPSTFLVDAHPDLVSRWVATVGEYEATRPGRHLLVMCTWRSAEEQAELYTHGRTAPGPIVTQLSGEPGHGSKHNVKPSRALDFAVLIGGEVSWDLPGYEEVGRIAESHGLIWGGSWPHFRDCPHVELPAHRDVEH